MMSKKRRNIAFERYYGSESRESLKSGTLCSSCSSIISRDNEKSEMSQIEKKKSMKRSSRTTLPVESKVSKNFGNFGIPEDVAVHFGNFYTLGRKFENNESNENDGRTNKSELPARDSPKSEFTRQMVHKLEKLAGTEYYARQISALLEETVESPNYVVEQPPEDDFFLDERHNILNYPLWYKNPDKMNYRSPIAESSNSLETGEENITDSATQLCESTSDSTLINTISNDDSRKDVTDLTSDCEPSSASSKVTFNSMENTTEDESNHEEFKINILVK